MKQPARPNTPKHSLIAENPPLALSDFLERCMGNASVATLVLDKLEAQLRADVRQISDDLLNQDAERIARTAHALKGSAAATAARALQELAAKIESEARQKELGAIGSDLSELRAEVERCLGYIPTARGILNQSALQPAPPELNS